MFTPFAPDPSMQGGAPIDPSYYASMMGNMSNQNVFRSPTYGMFGDEYSHMIHNPFGGQFQSPAFNSYYSSMLQNPIKTFFTYKVPLYMAPTGINPTVEDNYMEESKFQGISSAISLGSSIGGTMGGAALGSLVMPGVGTVIGSILGGMAGGKGGDILAGKFGEAAQIHESSMMLNTSVGGYNGVGLNMGQAASINTMIRKDSVNDPQFTAEEGQYSFNELAKHSLINDTGNFSDIKMHFKKMKHIVEDLRDVFNGDIKGVISSLRRFSTLGIDDYEMKRTMNTFSVAAIQKGQKIEDYTNDTLNRANSISSTTGLSKATSIGLKATLDSATDYIGKGTKGFYNNSVGSKQISEEFVNNVTTAISQTGRTGSLLLGSGGMSAQQYLLSHFEAGIQEYNKENGSDLGLMDVINNENLQKEMFRGGYVKKGWKKLNYKHDGDLGAIYSELSRDDSNYMSSMLDPNKTAFFTSKINSMDSEKVIINYMANLKKNLGNIDMKTLKSINPQSFDVISKILQMNEQNPELFRKISEASNKRDELVEKGEEHNKYIRNHSLEGMFRKVYNRFGYMSARAVSGIANLFNHEDDKLENGEAVTGFSMKELYKVNKLANKGSMRLFDGSLLKKNILTTNKYNNINKVDYVGSNGWDFFANTFQDKDDKEESEYYESLHNGWVRPSSSKLRTIEKQQRSYLLRKKDTLGKLTNKEDKIDFIAKEEGIGGLAKILGVNSSIGKEEIMDFKDELQSNSKIKQMFIEKLAKTKGLSYKEASNTVDTAISSTNSDTVDNQVDKINMLKSGKVAAVFSDSKFKKIWEHGGYKTVSALLKKHSTDDDPLKGVMKELENTATIQKEKDSDPTSLSNKLFHSSTEAKQALELFKGMSKKDIKNTIKNISQLGVVKYGSEHFGFNLNDTVKSEAFADTVNFVKQDEKTGKFSFLSDNELAKKGLSKQDLFEDLGKMGVSKDMYLATMNGKGDDLGTTNKILSNIEKLLEKNVENKKNNTYSF